MLHAISSQISILVAGLHRLEGQQRHPQPPPPPAAPDGQPPLPPPPISAPPAPSVRSTHPAVPITLVATSDNRVEPAGHVNPVSDSASRERRRRRRSRLIGVGHAVAVTTGVLLADLRTLFLLLTIALSCQSPPCSQGHAGVSTIRSAHRCAPGHANMRCLCCSAALLAWVVLAVISFAMWLSVEFVNNLVAVLNVLASQVATALQRSVSNSHLHQNPAYGYFFYLVYTCAIPTS